MSGIVDERIRNLRRNWGKNKEALEALLQEIKQAGLACAETATLAMETTKALAKALYHSNQETSKRIQTYNHNLQHAMDQLEEMVLTHHQEEQQQNIRSRQLEESILMEAIRTQMPSSVLETYLHQLKDSTKVNRLQVLYDTVTTKAQILNRLQQMSNLIDVTPYISQIEMVNLTDNKAKESLIALFEAIKEEIGTVHVEHTEILQRIESLHITLSSTKEVIDLLLKENINKLYELYETTEEIELQTTIQDILADINTLYQSLSGSEHFDEIDYMIQIMDSVFDIYQDSSLHLNTKVQLLEERRMVLFEQYETYQAMHEELMEQETALHGLILSNVVLREQMGLPIKEFDETERLDNLLLLVEQDNEKLLEEYHSLQETKRLQQSMRELLETRGYRHIASRQSPTRVGIQNQEYYIVDDGVILTVTTGTDGMVSNYVTGIPSPNKQTTQEDVIKSQHKFCGDYDEIRKSLLEQGFELDELQRLEPSAHIAYIEDHISLFTLEELEQIRAYHQEMEQRQQTKGRMRHE